MQNIKDDAKNVLNLERKLNKKIESDKYRYLAIKVGQKIRQIREEKRLSQDELAFCSGIHRTYIGQVERAEKNVTLITLKKICNGLNLNLVTFLQDVDC